MSNVPSTNDKTSQPLWLDRERLHQHMDLELLHQLLDREDEETDGRRLTDRIVGLVGMVDEDTISGGFETSLWFAVEQLEHRMFDLGLMLGAYLGGSLPAGHADPHMVTLTAMVQMVHEARYQRALKPWTGSPWSCPEWCSIDHSDTPFGLDARGRGFHQGELQRVTSSIYEGSADVNVDGSNLDGPAGVRVAVGGGEEANYFTPDQARAIAGRLLLAADTADGWSKTGERNITGAHVEVTR